jgi:hypothetical protein
MTQILSVKFTWEVKETKTKKRLPSLHTTNVRVTGESDVSIKNSSLPKELNEASNAFMDCCSSPCVCAHYLARNIEISQEEKCRFCVL